MTRGREMMDIRKAQKRIAASAGELMDLEQKTGALVAAYAEDPGSARIHILLLSAKADAAEAGILEAAETLRRAEGLSPQEAESIRVSLEIARQNLAILAEKKKLLAGMKGHALEAAAGRRAAGKLEEAASLADFRRALGYSLEKQKERGETK